MVPLTHLGLFVIHNGGQMGTYGAYSGYLQKVANSLNIPAAIYSMVMKRNLFHKAMRNLITSQDKLGIGDYDLPRPTKFVLISHFLIVIFNIFIQITLLAVTGWEDLLFSSYSAFFWMAMYTVITCTGFQFTYLVGAISDCLLRSKTVTIAKLKEQSFRPVYRQTSDSSAIQRSNNIIKQFVLTQHQIFGIFDDFGDVYSSFVAIYLLGLFLATTNSCFVLFVTKVLIWPEIVQYVLWVLHHVVVACNLFSSCEGFREHAEECNKALLSYVIHDRSEIYQDNPLVMIHLSSRKTLTFTACKCVNVDYRLGLSMIAAFLTYIVVLFQIEKSPNTNGTSFPINSTMA
ncbi:Hypothetical protein NTJ_14863 [Nesidiocoris tenuis]|uniref:Gustatory receptor n=1 Tax=Nesidiocoris tenuis TaxID=355587 RepID=A0ABN7BEH2_9HEMI|nr:Hypothetical protein NTJ_14863 [Nesidiocoris tenuis]